MRGPKPNRMDELKRDIFFRLMELGGRVYVHVRPGPEVRIGRRGFLNREQEDGLALVFTRDMNFLYDERGIEAVLAFQSRPEKCFVPAGSITAVYSPDLGAQFVVAPEAGRETAPATDSTLAGQTLEKANPALAKTGDKPKPAPTRSGDKVIKVDFKPKR